MKVDGKKLTKKFKRWHKEHGEHVIVALPYGRGYCARCMVMAPKPFKES